MKFVFQFKQRNLLVLLVALLVQRVSTSNSYAQDTVPKFPKTPNARIAKEFPISYWLPPIARFQNIERYQEIVDSGMTFMMAEVENNSPRERILNQLDLAQKTGRKMFINDMRMPKKITGEPGAKATIDTILKDYSHHPALAGYYLHDEPKATLFAGLGEVVAYLHEKDPSHPAYINIYPNYAPPEALGTATYEEYVREYLKQVKPFVLSYDHYNLVNIEKDGEGFFPNLATVRQIAKETKIPFWQCLQVVQLGNRNLNEAELRYEAMQTLAYGGKGIMWYTYWQTQAAVLTEWEPMILVDGTHTPHYDMVKKVNREVRALGGELLQAESVAVVHSGKIPAGVTGRAAGTPLDVTGAGNLTVGLFQRGRNENLALVTNADYKQAVKTEVMFFSGAKIPLIYNIATKKWQKPECKAKPGGFSVSLSLEASGAALLKW